MKNSIQQVIVLFLITLNINAQEEIDIKDLKTPNSPGFQILDIAPTSIERPTNPKALAANLLSLTNNGTVLPKNFAMEVSPYWYVKTDNASVYQYLSININDAKETYDFGGILRKISLSIASVSNDSTSGSLIENTNYISFGIRTNIFTYRTAAQNQKLQSSLKKITSKMADFKKNNETEKKDLIGMITKLEFDRDNEVDESKKSALNIIIKKLKDQLDEIINSSSEKLEKKLEADTEVQKNIEMLNELPIFQLDGAFAYSEAIPGNKYENKRFNRSGFWLNASLNAFSVDKDKLQDNLSFIAIVRFIRDNTLVENTLDEFQKNKAFDYGFKVEYTIKQLSISIESLKRKYSSDSDLNSDRTVGIIEYKINDNLYFTGAFGKNFGKTNNQFTLFGINYGFGKSSLKTE